MTKSKQAPALVIKLSFERRGGKDVPPPPTGRYSEQTRERALRDLEAGRRRKKRPAGKKKKAAPKG